MIIRDVKRVLVLKREATLAELVVDLGSERPLIRAALEYWRDRGSVEVVQLPGDAGLFGTQTGVSSCGGACGACVLSPACLSPSVHYRWIEPGR
ncbi:MAG TPA: hypothetical protein VMW87_04725 [Spirochaetia bacterium]|nr:hypothetical protein [Spirochaetia bacterium]